MSLKPGGRIVVVDFIKDSDFGPPRDHKMAKEVVIEELQKAGYRLIKSHDLLEQQYFLEFGI
jgi:predicted methyltransferase